MNTTIGDMKPLMPDTSPSANLAPSGIRWDVAVGGRAPLFRLPSGTMFGVTGDMVFPITQPTTIGGASTPSSKGGRIGLTIGH
jgi:hypothetical protein